MRTSLAYCSKGVDDLLDHSKLSSAVSVVSLFAAFGSLFVAFGSLIISWIAYYTTVIKPGSASIHLFLQPDFISINGPTHKGVPTCIITQVQYLVKNTGANPTVVKDMSWRVTFEGPLNWSGQVSRGIQVDDHNHVCALKPYEQRFGSLRLNLSPTEESVFRQIVDRGQLHHVLSESRAILQLKYVAVVKENLKAQRLEFDLMPWLRYALRSRD